MIHCGSLQPYPFCDSVNELPWRTPNQWKYLFHTLLKSNSYEVCWDPLAFKSQQFEIMKIIVCWGCDTACPAYVSKTVSLPTHSAHKLRLKQESLYLVLTVYLHLGKFKQILKVNQLKLSPLFNWTAEFRKVSDTFISLGKFIIYSRSQLQHYQPQADPCRQASRTACHSPVLHHEATFYYHLHTALCFWTVYRLFPTSKEDSFHEISISLNPNKSPCTVYTSC